VSFWPLVLYTVLVFLLVTAMIVSSHFLGPRHRDRATGDPFEGGILPAGNTPLRVSAKFYLFAMFFVIFDLEAAFIFTWAVAGRELGWDAFKAITLFVALLTVALIYLWRVGALEWRTTKIKGTESGPGVPRTVGSPPPRPTGPRFAGSPPPPPTPAGVTTVRSDV
jgi:NADH-quinone oxidoreductase subunit A